jgi:hypothetical protein
MKTQAQAQTRPRFVFIVIVGIAAASEAFVAPLSLSGSSATAVSALFAVDSNRNSNTINTKGLSILPKDISPFEKSGSKRRDVQGDFRKLAASSLQKALQNGVTQLEVEFPPLLGGDQSKSQFDDFDNVQELNKNRDWCIELLPSLSTTIIQPVWFILPDLKEVELAKEEWGGQRYRQAAQFTSIEAVTEYYGDYDKPWGATFASGMSSFLGGSDGDSGLLGDQSTLDPLDEADAALHLVCQPGNGGPVEDWINVKAFHEAAAKGGGGGDGGKSIPTCIVNGALDKVRDGYYASFIFPKLAKTFDFYRGFEAVFFLKPISDKGVYGWVYRVYPEPWQVVLQTPSRDDKKDPNKVVIIDTVVLVSETRPTYQECVQALLSTATTANQQQ